MTPKERAENIVLASRQDRYAKATLFLEYVTSQIEEAERDIKEKKLEWAAKESDSAFERGFAAAREKAKGIAEEQPITDWGERIDQTDLKIKIAKRIAAMNASESGEK